MPRGKSGGERNGDPPGKTGVDEDYVTLSTLRELLDQQKHFYKDMANPYYFMAEQNRTTESSRTYFVHFLQFFLNLTSGKIPLFFTAG